MMLGSGSPLAKLRGYRVPPRAGAGALGGDIWGHGDGQGVRSRAVLLPPATHVPSLSDFTIFHPLKCGGFYGDRVPRMGGAEATAARGCSGGDPHLRGPRPPASSAQGTQRPHGVPCSVATWGGRGGQQKRAAPHLQEPPPLQDPSPAAQPRAVPGQKPPPQQSSPRTRSREKNAERLRGLKLKPTPGIIAGEIHLNKRRWQTSSGSRAGAVMCKDNKIHDKAQREEQGFAIPRYSSINTFPF